jgi:hypothetical protein
MTATRRRHPMTTIRPTDPDAVDTRTASAVSEQRVLEAAGVFARAGTALRHCLADVPAADDAAWAAYSEAAGDAITHLQVDLVLAGARLNAERATDHEEVRSAITAASRLALHRLETLRARARLGVVGVDSLAGRAVEELELVAHGLRDRSRRVHAATGSVEDARRTAADAIHGARRALMAVAAAAASGDITFDEDRHRP